MVHAEVDQRFDRQENKRIQSQQWVYFPRAFSDVKISAPFQIFKPAYAHNRFLALRDKNPAFDPHELLKAGDAEENLDTGNEIDNRCKTCSKRVKSGYSCSAPDCLPVSDKQIRCSGQRKHREKWKCLKHSHSRKPGKKLVRKAFHKLPETIQVCYTRLQ